MKIAARFLPLLLEQDTSILLGAFHKRIIPVGRDLWSFAGLTLTQERIIFQVLWVAQGLAQSMLSHSKDGDSHSSSVLRCLTPPSPIYLHFTGDADSLMAQSRQQV